jgi:hypothetical protein
MIPSQEAAISAPADRQDLAARFFDALERGDKSAAGNALQEGLNLFKPDLAVTREREWRAS